MKKSILLLFLLNKISYSISVNENKKSYEYLLAQSFWNLIICSSGIIFISLIAYYLLVLFSIYKNSSKLYSIIDINIFNNKFYNKKELVEEVLIKFKRCFLLIILWFFTVLISLRLEMFPFFLILFFIIAIKPFFIAIFPSLTKYIIEKFLLYFIILLIILSLGTENINIILKNIFNLL